MKGSVVYDQSKCSSYVDTRAPFYDYKTVFPSSDKKCKRDIKNFQNFTVFLTW